MLESRDKLLRELFNEEGEGSSEGVGLMNLNATTQGLTDDASAEGHEFHSDHTHSGEADPAESPEGAEFHADGFHAEVPEDEAGIGIAEPAETKRAPAGKGFRLEPGDMRRSVIMAEVLGKPVSLRRGR